MEASAVRVAAVDIGTNSMRLLVTDGAGDVARIERVTGLGRGVDATRRLADDAIERTLVALREFREIIAAHGAGRVRAIATSACRDATNREEFFDLAEQALGVRPDLIPGEEEARLGYAGATMGWHGPRPAMVVDIGGGSTEFVTEGAAVSVDIGSVRLTERKVPSRPAPPQEVEAAFDHLRELFGALDLPRPAAVIGVGGSWTEVPELAGVVEQGSDVHGLVVTREQIGSVVDRLAEMTVEETAQLVPAMRAPVMLAGVIISAGVLDVLGIDEAVVSIRDSLDGVAAGLLGDGLA
ncbi:MAG: exopolyphosphatase [Actinomycetes bacterium]